MTALKILKRIYDRFKKLCTTDKVKLILALVMTTTVFIVAPTLAWFSYQKKMATIAKIDSPAKITFKAGAGEDIINFKMAGIDTKGGSPQDFVFCVEGEDITRYNLQLAHTTNINFTYKIYRAKETESTSGIQYVKSSNSEPVYYEKIGQAIPMSAVNGVSDEFSTRTLGNDQYDEPSYQPGDAVHKFAEPLYSQLNDAITANSTNKDYDEFNEDESAFRNYYVLEVSWGSDVVNDKETDMIYLTAQVAQ